MSMQPEFSAFKDVYEADKPQLVWETRVADIETPITASLKLMEAGEPFFLLESVENGANRGRYSIIGLKPDLIWEATSKNESWITRKGQAAQACEADTLTAFRQIQQESQFDIPDSLPPMASGLIGYMSYDTIRLIEAIPDSNPDNIDIPLACFMRPTIMVIFDSINSNMHIATTVWPDQLVGADTAFKQASSRIKQITDKLRAETYNFQNPTEDTPISIDFESNMTRDEYHAMVEKAKSYIVDGDIFQVVPSQRFEAAFDVPPFAFYRSLRHLNPSPYLFFLNFGSFQLIGSSPEILVRARDETVTIRPLAGTRKRGATKTEDAELAANLLADQKEISEHLMLIDLSRNDVGRVSQAGSVHITEYMEIEYYSHVMHIVSNVEGKLDPKYDAIDALFAGLPVGTVSGAPKIRAMEIIDELEKVKRSFYAGCVGYFSADGSMDTCITLRTGLIKDNRLYLQAGGGVVADSDPEAEYQESLNKAKALMKAAENSINFV